MVREADERPPRSQPGDLRCRAAGAVGDDDRPRPERLGEVVATFDIARPTSARARFRGAGGGSASTARPRGDAVHRPDRLDRVAPMAVSAESITADVPSRIAFATSLASARVGSACSTIDSSICVAVITGFPASRQRRMIRFCSSGTVAAPISTPRSPRATITPSASVTMSSSASTASAFSIFAITRRRRAPRRDELLQLADVRGRPDERQRDEVDAEPERELEVVQVLLGERRDRDATPGQVHALVRGDLAADDDAAAGAAALDLSTSSRTSRRRSARRGRARAPRRSPRARP